jgi:hypothetical protein
VRSAIRKETIQLSAGKYRQSERPCADARYLESIMTNLLCLLGGIVIGAVLGIWFIGLSEQFWDDLDSYWRNK